MKNTFGNAVTVTVFGESHSAAIGAVLDGIEAGISVDTEFIGKMLSARRPAGTISTARKEQDEFQIVSGVFGGKTTGTPICIIIPNSDIKSKDYDAFRGKARPSHADYTAFVKYGGAEDYRGGGHFSGRITAALVAAGALIMPELSKRGIEIGTHISKIGSVCDGNFSDYTSDFKKLKFSNFAVLSETKREEMLKCIEEARQNNDSVGGELETVVTGLPVGLGEPMFDSVESRIAHILFSVPAVKGIEFGAGFGFADMLGSEANDEFRLIDGKVVTTTNNNGGINGGITNGMPVVFKTAIKPTPSIGKPQKTVDFINNENADITVGGRHDPCIVHRARPVVDAVTAIAIYDLLIESGI